MTGYTRIKICGITSLENALMCAQAGADLLGLNFYPPSPRYIDPAAARVLTGGLRAALGDRCPVLVGVFVNAGVDDLAHVMQVAGLDAVQLSGDEPLATVQALQGRVIKALRPRHVDDARALSAQFAPHGALDGRLPSLLVDAYHKALYGGTGEEASIEVALAVRERVPRLMLAGGLKPANVAARVRAIRPWGVDVASGVEAGTPGIKDPALVKALVDAVREADRA